MKRTMILGLAVLFLVLPGLVAAELIPMRPCRLFDTRDGAGTPLSGGSVTYYDVREECGVPPNATGVTYNVTVVGATGAGYVTMFPRDSILPAASSLNFAAGEVRGNAGLVQLSRTLGTEDLAIFVATNPPGGTAHVILDLTGYTAGSLAAVAARAVADHGFNVDRFDIVGDGTAIDRLTGLQWELKTDDGTDHDWDNVYTWSTTAPFDTPTGSVFTSFLSALTNFPCFAGYCDWRLPTMDELQTLMEPAFGDCTISPCTVLPGPTKATWYFSGTTDGVLSTMAWAGDFGTSQVLPQTKTGFAYARAVRGGVAPAP